MFCVLDQMYTLRSGSASCSDDIRRPCGWVRRSRRAAVWGVGLHFHWPSPILLRIYGILIRLLQPLSMIRASRWPEVEVSILARPLAEPPLIQKAPKADLWRSLRPFPSNLPLDKGPVVFGFRSSVFLLSLTSGAIIFPLYTFPIAKTFPQAPYSHLRCNGFRYLDKRT